MGFVYFQGWSIYLLKIWAEYSFQSLKSCLILCFQPGICQLSYPVTKALWNITPSQKLSCPHLSWTSRKVKRINGVLKLKLAKLSEILEFPWQKVLRLVHMAIWFIPSETHQLYLCELKKRAQIFRKFTLILDSSLLHAKKGVTYST